MIIKIKSKTRKVRKQIIQISPNDASQIKLKRKTEVERQKDNIRTILKYSNATPIGKYGGIGYACAFCTQEYATPAELKSHTKSEHEEVISIFMDGKGIHNYLVKLDITNLKCDICQRNIDKLEELVDHLKSMHDKFFYSGLKNHTLPFKFDDDDVIRCVYCHNVYGNFKVLLEHMNTHSRNYVCVVCDSGFVNKKTLLTHAYRHKTGVFNCSYCPKIFNTHIKRREHEKNVHVSLNKRSKCGYCGEKFTDYAKKNNHEAKVHGAKPIVLKCQACDKTFDNQRALTVHTKTYHLMQKHNAR